MKTSNYVRKDYYNDLSRSRYSSQTSRRLKSAHNLDLNDTKTRFMRRLDKVCTTNNGVNMNREFSLYRLEIQRLEKQILKKDKQIFQIKASTQHHKEVETELIETYRVLFMYEGKMAQYEKQLKRLEVMIAGKQGKLLESYREENAELQGRVQEKNRVVMELQAKMKRLQNKYFNTEWKLSSTKRQIKNPMKQRFPNLRNTIMINEAPLVETERAMNLTNENKYNNRQLNYYEQQTQQSKTKIIAEREPIRFRRYENKVQKQEQYQQNSPIQGVRLAHSVSAAYNNINPASRTIIEQQRISVSPTLQRKIYSSPINRFQLNKKVTEVEGMFGTSPNKSRFLYSSGQNTVNSRTVYLQ